MRPNIVTEAGLQTRVGQWWAAIPFVTSGVLVVCVTIYLLCLLLGYDSFHEVCLWPSAVISRFQVYRIYTAVIFHGSVLHVLFNMLAVVPLSAELERIIGSVRLAFLMLMLAMSNGLLHILLAFAIANNPFHPYPYLINECAIGFSGILFSMIVIETSLSGAQARSFFGLFNVPAKWYAWLLLIVIQLLASNVSLLGHLCGILSGFAYAYGLLNFLLPGPSFYSAIESTSIMSPCLRRPGFILSTGGASHGSLPTYSNATTSSVSGPGNVWRNLSSWMQQRETTMDQPSEDPRFPGRGRTLESARNHTPVTEPDLSLHDRLLDNNTSNHFSETTVGQRIADIRSPAVDTPGATMISAQNLDSDTFEDDVKKLVSMGFEKTKSEVALAAADGDPIIAVEILMNQTGLK